MLGSDGRVAIAKFPSVETDDWDVMRWESVAITLAMWAGIKVAAHEIKEVDGKPVLMIERFDRRADVRIGYVSALTMLDLLDGDRASYLEIAEVIVTNSPKADEDLEELWRRIVFSVLISNFDDHLRNHGFLRTSVSGWSLSPAFDLNPDPRPGGRLLKTSIDLDSYEARIDLAMESAPEFRLSRERAVEVLGEVTAATSRWRTLAESIGLVQEIDLMSPAFEHAEAHAAREFVA